MERICKGALGRAQREVILVGLGSALLVAAFSPLASPNPDGLVRVAETQGFVGLGQAAPYEILSGYAVPFISHPALTTIARFVPILAKSSRRGATWDVGTTSMARSGPSGRSRGEA